MLCLKVTLYSSLFKPVCSFIITLLNTSPIQVKLTYLVYRMKVAKFGSSKEIIKGLLVILIDDISL